jgi:hypothetical protein
MIAAVRTPPLDIGPWFTSNSTKGTSHRSAVMCNHRHLVPNPKRPV